MAKTRLYLDKRKPRMDGTCPVHVAISKDSNTRLVNTGLYILPKHWDRRTARVIGRGDRDFLNDYLAQMRSRVDMVMLRARLDGTLADMTSADIKRLATGDEAKAKPKRKLLEYMAEDAATKKGTTARNRLSVMASVRKYLGEGKAAGFPLAAITRKWLDGWLDHMETVQGLGRNTAVLYLSTLGTIHRKAVDEGLATGDPFKGMDKRKAPTARRSLTVDGLREILKRDLEGDMAKWRDMFILDFMLIGINMEDLWRLTAITHDGRIDYVRAKTGKRYSIKVEPEAMAIIDRYRGTDRLLAPCERHTSAQGMTAMMNNALHSLRPGLTTYWARHTWATIASDLDIPDDVISRALGHSGLTGARVTEVYINFNNKKIDQANRKVLDWVLHGKR